MLLEHLLVVALLVAVPVWDHVETRRLKTTTDPQAKVQSYWKTLAGEWCAVALLLVIRGPQRLYALERGEALSWVPRETVMAVAMGLLIGIVAPVVIALASAAARARLAKRLTPLMFFLPQKPRERRWFVVVCVTAGICEELIDRGFVMQYLHALPVGLSLTTALLLSCVLFGVAHLYQGPAGMLQTGLFAGLMGVLFVTTGNLLLPMVAHTMLDLRVLALVPPNDERPSQLEAVANVHSVTPASSP
jgi:membrane protease YdiL (CAAX protease family)